MSTQFDVLSRKINNEHSLARIRQVQEGVLATSMDNKSTNNVVTMDKIVDNTNGIATITHTFASLCTLIGTVLSTLLYVRVASILDNETEYVTLRAGSLSDDMPIYAVGGFREIGSPLNTDFNVGDFTVTIPIGAKVEIRLKTLNS